MLVVKGTLDCFVLDHIWSLADDHTFRAFHAPQTEGCRYIPLATRL